MKKEFIITSEHLNIAYGDRLNVFEEDLKVYGIEEREFLHSVLCGLAKCGYTVVYEPTATKVAETLSQWGYRFEMKEVVSQ